MSKEKQIEEMAMILCRGGCEKCIQTLCADWYKAERLYEAGYRKQSEWISAEERLPTWEDGKVLIYTPYGISIAERTTSNRWRGDCAIPKLITHWMPLPEAPKGGAE
jgi:hypothetical protein